MTCKIPFENGSRELKSTNTKKCPYDPPPFLIWMRSAQTLKWHLCNFSPTGLWPLKSEFHLQNYYDCLIYKLLNIIKKEKDCKEQPIFNFLKQFQSHP